MVKIITKKNIYLDIFKKRNITLQGFTLSVIIFALYSKNIIQIEDEEIQYFSKIS